MSKGWEGESPPADQFELFTEMMEDLAGLSAVHRRLALRLAAADVSQQQKVALASVMAIALDAIHRASHLLLSWSLGEKAPSILHSGSNRTRH